jgi:hypothetical protein
MVAGDEVVETQVASPDASMFVFTGSEVDQVAFVRV